jgi:hypothetical protein
MSGDRPLRVQVRQAPHQGLHDGGRRRRCHRSGLRVLWQGTDPEADDEKG